MNIFKRIYYYCKFVIIHFVYEKLYRNNNAFNFYLLPTVVIIRNQMFLGSDVDTVILVRIFVFEFGFCIMNLNNFIFKKEEDKK